MNQRRVFKINFLAEEVSVLIYGLEGLLRRPDLDGDVLKCARETLASIREDANRHEETACEHCGISGGRHEECGRPMPQETAPVEPKCAGCGFAWGDHSAGNNNNCPKPSGEGFEDHQYWCRPAEHVTAPKTQPLEHVQRFDSKPDDERVQAHIRAHSAQRGSMETVRWNRCDKHHLAHREESCPQCFDESPVKAEKK